MKKQPLYKVLLVLLLPTILIACQSNKEKKPKQQKNKTAADYVKQATFTTLEGDTASISDFKGKVVMIDFWETWCKPCIASFPAIQKLQENYSGKFVSLAVTPGFSDTKKDAKRFKKAHDYNFIYAMDTSNLHKKLGVTAIPYKIFVAANGKFIKVSMGSSGAKQDYKKIEKIIKKYSKKGTNNKSGK